MLIINSKINQYTKQGSIVFVYSVKSDLTDKKLAAEEITAYKESQGTYYRESDDKQPLYFSARVVEPGTQLHAPKTPTGRYTTHTDLESLAAEKDSLTNQALAKIQAIASYTGLSKAKMQERLLANF